MEIDKIQQLLNSQESTEENEADLEAELEAIISGNAKPKTQGGNRGNIAAVKSNRSPISQIKRKDERNVGNSAKTKPNYNRPSECK